MLRPGRAIALVALALIAAAPARADFGQDAYTPVTVAPGGFLTMYGGAVSDGSGGMLVTWTDSRTGQPHVYLQRLNGTGAVAAGWPAGGLQVCSNAAAEYTPSLFADGAGGAYVAWSDARGTNRDIYVTRVTGAAAYVAGFTASGLLVSTGGAAPGKDDFTPVMTTDGAGGTFVVWTLQFGTGDVDIYGAQVAAGGALLWSAALYAPVGVQSLPKPLPDGSGGFFVGFADNDNGTLQHAKVAHFNSSGSMTWGPSYVGTGSGFNQYSFDVAPDASGGIYAICSDTGPGYANITGNHFLASGTNDPQWGGYKFLVPISNDSQGSPVALADGSGGLLFAFTDSRYGGPDLFAMRLGPYALPYNGWPAGGVALATESGNQFPETMLPDGSGGAVIAMLDDRLGLDYLLYAVRVMGDGSIAPGWAFGGNPVDLGGLIDIGFTAPATVSDGSGGALFAWGDERGFAPYSGYAGVYAQNMDRFGALGDARPHITRVADVPNDQGGSVSLQWTASDLDALPSRTVTQYTIWRRVPGGTAAAAAARAALEGAGVSPAAASASAGPERAGTTAAAASAAAERAGTAASAIAAAPKWRATRDGAQVVYWGYVATQPALMLSGYSAVVSTTSDSMPGSNPLTSLMVVAESAGGVEFWQSAPDSGYSVDNIPPYAPAPFLGTYAAGVATLHWSPVMVSDLANYRLYRGTAPTFLPGPASFVASTIDTAYVDYAGGPYYYRLTAVDIHGNESASTLLLPSGVTGVSGADLPRELALAAPTPNPARGATVLRFALPREASVRLALYDVSGRLVRVLAAGVQPAGEHAAAWDLHDGNGQPVGAGLYFARLEAEGRMLVQRVMALR